MYRVLVSVFITISICPPRAPPRPARDAGHEYTELRNTNAAVHAYRQAIAHDRHDYRAWYGLGQMYEILNLPSFALHYYR